MGRSGDTSTVFPPPGDNPVSLLDFREQGACRGLDPDLFFPERGESVDHARAVCAECPVADACLDWALRHERLGIWAGTSERQRRQMRRQLGIRVETLGAWPLALGCGTAAGYQAHRRRGEETCVACRHAHAATQLRRRAVSA